MDFQQPSNIKEGNPFQSINSQPENQNVTYPNAMVYPTYGAGPSHTYPTYSQPDNRNDSVVSPLYGKSDSSEPTKKRRKKCCGMGCCKCFCCTFCLLLFFVSCLICVGGAIFGIVAGSIYGYCVSEGYSGTDLYQLNDTQISLTFSNYGNFKIVESDKYKVEVKYFFKHDGERVKPVFTEDGASFKHGGWKSFGHVCEGFHVILYKPAEKRVSLSLDNHLGGIQLANTEFKIVSITQHFGLLNVSGAVFNSLDVNVHDCYTKMESVSADFFTLTTEDGFVELKDFEVPNKVGLNSKYSDVEIKGWSSGDLDIHCSDQRTKIDCADGSFPDLTAVLDRGYLEIENCNTEGGRIDIDTFRSDVHLKNIKNTDVGKWAQIKVERFRQGYFGLKNLYQINIDALKVEDCTMDIKIAKDNFLPNRVDFDISGESSTFKTKDQTTEKNFIEKSIDKGSHVEGTINNNGTDVSAHYNVKAGWSTVQLTLVDDF